MWRIIMGIVYKNALLNWNLVNRSEKFFQPQKLQEILGLHIKLHSKPAINTCVQNNNTVNKKKPCTADDFVDTIDWSNKSNPNQKKRFYQQQKRRERIIVTRWVFKWMSNIIVSKYM